MFGNLNKWILPDHPNLRWDEVLPEWVEKIEAANVAPTQTVSQCLLYDRQFNLKTEEMYYRSVIKVLQGGVEESSRVEISFDPVYESVKIHSISVKRDGISVDSLLSKEAHLLQREECLEEHLYSGRLSLIFFLHNVRVGDLIETCYTIHGQNPIEKDTFCANFVLAFNTKIEKCNLRFLHAADRPLYFKTYNTSAVIEEKILDEELKESKLLLSPVENYDWPETPHWYQGYPWLQVSSFVSWEEVQEWAAQLFDTTMPSEEILNLVKTWKKQSSTDEEFVLEALEYVQNEIRYLGIEEGVYALFPHAPDIVLKQGYGDCKDKTMLLLNLLRAAGYKVNASLVSNNLTKGIANWNPTIAAFDHVILKLTLQGNEYWLDPVLKYQAGDLKQHSRDFYGIYLDIGNDIAGLTKRPVHYKENAIEAASIYTVHPDHAEVEISTNYLGSQANRVREQLEQIGKEKLAENFKDYYARIFDGAKAVKEPNFVDDKVQNKMTVTESYLLENCIKSDEKIKKMDFYPTYISDALPKSIGANQSVPYPFNHPERINETIKIILPTNANGIVGEEELLNETFHYKHEWKELGNEVEIKFSYETLADHINSSEFEKVNSQLKKMKEQIFFSYQFPASMNVISESNSSLFFIFFLSKCALFGALYLLFRDRTDEKIRKQWLTVYWLLNIAYGVCVISSLILTGVKEGPEKMGELFSIMVIGIFFRILVYFRGYKKQKRLFLGFFIGAETLTALSLLGINDSGIAFIVSFLFMTGVLFSLITSIQLFKLNGKTSLPAHAMGLMDKKA